MKEMCKFGVKTLRGEAEMKPGRPMKVRPRILAAAESLYLERGLDVPLQDIACEAQCSRQALYYHFSSKDELLREVFADLRGQIILPELDNEQLDLPASLLAIARAVQAHFMDKKVVAFHRLMVVAMVNRPELVEMMGQREPEVLIRVASLLALYNEKGVIQLNNPHLAAQAFLGAIMGLDYTRLILGAEPVEKGQEEALVQQVVRDCLKAWSYQKS